jgi:hypothetical protein
MVVEVPLNTGETVRMPGNPVKLSAAQPPWPTPARRRWASTRGRSASATWWAMTAEKLEALRQAGTIA